VQGVELRTQSRETDKNPEDMLSLEYEQLKILKLRDTEEKV